MIRKAAYVVMLATAVGWSGSARAAAGVEATFEGHVIDLAGGWGQAKACVEVEGAVACYRSERQMLDAYDTRSVALAATAVEPTAALTCASSLRLYDGAGFGGQVLMLTSRQVGLNLSSYGFDNKTSSYKVGACGVSMYSSANLGGSLYQGATGANASAASMNAGWDNAVSSVWIG